MMDLEIAQVCERAAKRIENGHWTQETAARDNNGNPVGVTSAEAVCWCLWGAIMAETGAGDDIRTISAVEEVLYGNRRAMAVSQLEVSAVLWNDHEERTEKEVVDLLKVVSMKYRLRHSGMEG